MTTPDEAAARIKWVSEYLDKNIGKNSRGNVDEGIGLDALRLIKLMEECGEVVTNFIAFRNLNPRKAIANAMETGTEQPIVKELYDVAFTAIGAAEHFIGNSGLALEQFMAHASGVKMRLQSRPEPHYAQADPHGGFSCVRTSDLWDGPCGRPVTQPNVPDADEVVHMDPKPWYVEEADTTTWPDGPGKPEFDGRYSWHDWLHDDNGYIENLAGWKPRIGYVQEKVYYRLEARNA